MRELVIVGTMVLASVLSVATGEGTQVDPENADGQLRLSSRSAVSLSPRQTYLAPSEICTLYVVADAGMDSLGCVECWVSFDTTLLSLIHAEEGELFEDAPFQRLFFWQTIAPDTQSVEGCLLGYQSFTLSPGEVARFVFQGIQEGVSPVRITRLRFWDINRDMFEPVVEPNAWITVGSPTAIDPSPTPKEYLTSYPNPFNPSVTLVLSLPPGDEGSGGVAVSVTIYAPDGRRVRRLFSGIARSGKKTLVWDGLNDKGIRVASGAYFAVATTGENIYRTKLVLIE